MIRSWPRSSERGFFSAFFCRILNLIIKIMYLFIYNIVNFLKIAANN
jgi:hypothetical protein